jgi:hypothetical protein
MTIYLDNVIKLGLLIVDNITDLYKFLDIEFIIYLRDQCLEFYAGKSINLRDVFQ